MRLGDRLDLEAWEAVAGSRYHLRRPALIRGWEERSAVVRRLRKRTERRRLLKDFGGEGVLLGLPWELAEGGRQQAAEENRREASLWWRLWVSSRR